MLLFKRIAILILSGTLAAACGDDDETPAARPQQLRIRATAAPVLTADGRPVAECSVEWSGDDAFGLWNRSAAGTDNNVRFALDGSPDEGLFAGEVSTAPGLRSHTLRALGLYREKSGFDPSYLSVKVPVAQAQTAGRCDLKRYGFLVARAEEADLGTGETELEFSTPCAVLKLLIDASGTVLAEKRLQHVRIEAEQPVAGSMIYDLERSRIEVPANGRVVGLTLSDAPSLGTPCPAWFTLCAADLGESELRVELLCTDKSIVEIVCPGVALEAGRMSELRLDLSALIAAGDAEISEYRVDLSAEGTANCYVVSEPEKYEFRPTRGNSNEAPEGMTRVDWLWMSEEGLISEVGFEKGKVVFRAGEKRGNAVIAAFDAAGGIVWSWHIWLTENPAAQLHFGMTSSYRLLDRNLGAVSTEVDDYRSYGLYYQWGRKDPFVGARHSGTLVKREEMPGFTTATAEYVSNPACARAFTLVKNTDLEAGGEIAYTVANPMHFVCFASEENGSGQTWFHSDFKNYLTLWGYNDATASSSKTVYDPCPVGYKVPSFTGTVYAGIGAAQLPVSSSAGLSGVLFTGAGGTSYYPAAGFRDHTGGFLSYMGLCSTFWSAMTYKNVSVRGMKIEPTGKTYVNTNIKFNAAYGQTVRCVKE